MISAGDHTVVAVDVVLSIYTSLKFSWVLYTCKHKMDKPDSKADFIAKKIAEFKGTTATKESPQDFLSGEQASEEDLSDSDQFDGVLKNVIQLTCE